MSVRLKISLTIVATGLVTALAVIATVLFAFERFEREMSYHRGTQFLGRVGALHDDLMGMHERHPEDFNAFLRNLVLFEPDTQLYLLDPAGVVLSSTGNARLPPGFAVSLGPVQQSASRNASYVMGDDPEHMDADCVVAALPLRRAVIRQTDGVSGYLYLVAHKAFAPSGRWQVLQMSFGGPALWLIAGIVAFTTCLAAVVVSSVTRPLRQLTAAAAKLSEKGLHDGATEVQPALPPPTRDEFGQLTRAFAAMLTTLQSQWSALRRLDHFRREAVSNLSHDLRSPLTAVTGCLETLENRWSGQPERADDLRLARVALHNTRNAAGLVQSLGELATLDEPTFELRPEPIDLHELLDHITMRFAERAAAQGITLQAQFGPEPVAATVDVELFERAVANLVDNALKFCGRGSAVTVTAHTAGDGVEVVVADNGPGISPGDVEHLFDRFYQVRHGTEPASADQGRGLGLAIVKRIAELHRGGVSVHSVVGQGTRMTLRLPV